MIKENYLLNKNVSHFKSKGGTKNSHVSKFCAKRDRRKTYISKKAPISLHFRLFSTFTLISLITTYITNLLKLLIINSDATFI